MFLPVLLFTDLERLSFGRPLLALFLSNVPKAVLLTLNAIAGIGMLAVGILGGPVIGKLTEDSIKVSVEEALLLKPTNRSPRIALTSWVHYTAVDTEKWENLLRKRKLKLKKVFKMESKDL